MVVRNPIDELEGFIAYDIIERGGYHSGGVSGWMEAGEPSKRPIGFRVREREAPEPTSPEGMLF
jgi:hypothetical protein